MADTFNTINGQQTDITMAQQLAAAGYSGPTDPSSIETAYAGTTGGSVTPMGSNVQTFNNNDPNNPPSNSSSTSTSTSTSTNNSTSSAAAAMDQQLSTLIQALSATNEQDFQEKVSEFNQSHALALQQFGLSQQAQQFSQAATTAGLTGVMNGQPTLAAAEQQANLTGYYTPPNATLSANALSSGGGSAGGAPSSGPTQQQYITARTQQLQGMGWNPQQASQTALSEWNQGFAQSGNVAGGLPQGISFTAPATSGATGTGTAAPPGPPTSAPIQTLAGQAQQAQLTGQFNGQNTPAYQQELANITGQFNGQPTEATREFNTNTGVDLTKLQASLSGPADYFKYLTAQNGGRNIMSSLSGQPMPQAGPVGQTQPQSVQNLLSGLGIGQPQQAAAQSGTSQANPQGGQAPGGGGITIPGFESFGSLPQPNQIPITNWNALGATGQSFMKGAYAAAGYDPNDLERQIMAQAPSTGAAPTSGSTTTNFGASAGSSLYG